MESTREELTDRRCLVVSLRAWGLISAILFARGCAVSRTEFTLTIFLALVSGGILTVIAVSLPFRVFQNVTQPERRKARLRETVLCILAFLSLAYMLISAIINYPSGW